jgi:hypothetical protein
MVESIVGNMGKEIVFRGVHLGVAGQGSLGWASYGFTIKTVGAFSRLAVQFVPSAVSRLVPVLIAGLRRNVYRIVRMAAGGIIAPVAVDVNQRRVGDGFFGESCPALAGIEPARRRVLRVFFVFVEMVRISNLALAWKAGGGFPYLPMPERVSSGARMVFVMQLLEPFPGDVGIDLGGRNIGVAQQHLHHAQVRAVIE